MYRKFVVPVVGAIVLMLFVSHASATPPPQTARSNASIFGMNIGQPDGAAAVLRDYQEAANLGVRWARFELGWHEIEPKPGRLNFRRYDRELGTYRRYGLTAPGLIQGTPAWACAARTRDLHSCPPKPGRAYKRFIRKLVAHFKDRIGVWEVWNEPNISVFWRPKPSAAAYARLLRVTYGVIKAVDPTATVLFGSTAGTDLPFTAAVLRKLKGAPAFDAVSIHPYRFPYGPLEAAPGAVLENGEQPDLTFKQELLAEQDTFERYGYGRPDMWVTEIGWDADGIHLQNDFVTLEQQAQFLEETYKQVQTDPDLAFVKVVFWFASRDSSSPNASSESLLLPGLLRSDYSPKPAAETYRRLASAG